MYSTTNPKVLTRTTKAILYYPHFISNLNQMTFYRNKSKNKIRLKRFSSFKKEPIMESLNSRETLKIYLKIFIKGF